MLWIQLFVLKKFARNFIGVIPLYEKEVFFFKHITIKNCDRTFRKSMVKNF